MQTLQPICDVKLDVCHEDPASGSCTQWQTRFYYDKGTHTCRPFSYSGCDGTGNRFADYEECENVCILSQEPPTTENKGKLQLNGIIFLILKLTIKQLSPYK